MNLVCSTPMMQVEQNLCLDLLQQVHGSSLQQRDIIVE